MCAPVLEERSFSFRRLTAKVSIVCLIDTVGEDRTTVGLRYRLLVGEKSAFRRTSSLTGLDSSTSPLLAPPPPLRRSHRLSPPHHPPAPNTPPPQRAPPGRNSFVQLRK
ncbi:uncharacterized protein V6R79_000645 [Siganus canaliculatus]